MGKRINLNTPASQLFMVGPVYAKRLEKLGVKTVENLLYHLPRRYEDFSIIAKIGTIQAGETVTIQGQIKRIENEYTKKGKTIQKAIIQDNTGAIQAISAN